MPISCSARPWARLLLMAGAAAAPGAAFATDGEAEPPPIVVTGTRAAPLEQPPGTAEGLDAARIDEIVNAISTEDVLRYLPSLAVRKRHIGDTQAPLATRTSGVGASARSLIYADGILLSALIGNNNSNASPRWAMVSPEEITRVDVLYGPFSAAFPGNSIGAVVTIETRLPDGPEGSAHVGAGVQHFDQYATSGTFPSWQAAGTWGGRSGRFAWFLAANHVASESQPLAYVSAVQPTNADAAGLPVTGAIPDRNRAGMPIFLLGAGGFENQVQDTLGLKLAFDLAPHLRLIYRGGLFLNDTDASAQTYLRDAAGQPIFAGAVNIGGRSLNIPATAFSNNVYRLDERHWMHALALEGSQGRFEWRALASLYDFDRDVQRIPSGALAAAGAGGAGSITRLDGTGWLTFDLVGRRHGDGHDLSFGAHLDRFLLASRRFATTEWRRGGEGALVQAAEGQTRTMALWLQDRWTLAPSLELVLGGRAEWWRAYDGLNFSLAPALSTEQPVRTRAALSPKASLAWQPGPGWRIALSAGQAWRFPTVSELYQAVTTGPTISVPDPDLRPERARSEELAITRSLGAGHVRLSLFNECIRDALIAQAAPLVAGSGTLFSFVQNIPKVRTHGLEATFDWPVNVAFQLSGSVTLVDPRILADPVLAAAEGKDIPQVPRRRATLVATWRPSARASFTLAGRYSSRSFATIDNSDVVTHTYQGFEAYLALDARATIRLGDHLEAAFGVENLTNARTFIFHPFPQRSANAEISYRW
jgi:iron complex outermembrane recepter protein